ncbi:RNA polymerase sigma factor [Jiangella aurantiaca]|uniref:RNA polymerase sigma factor n=1 Tax=Jiangella aurantiaca TaxID=2530373 RepID=A0A4R5A3V1_9ACTN|nr:DUF6596 domain-containing protein [Jiangella aurantiaca]TDD65344.1 RNA polymerase sigma factor [Jiangella aurantiaca]
MPDTARIERIFREESGRSVAALIRAFGDIDLAEDAVQEAFAVALRHWPAAGLPPNPGGWITTTARTRAIDRLRRESRGRELLGELALLAPGRDDDGFGGADDPGPVRDDRLRLIFTCCHPALSREAQVALTLRLLGGLSTADVARSFLVSEATMAQRLVRAKRKIKAARIPYRVPEAHELAARLEPVLAVVYLIYNAGVTSPAGPEPWQPAARPRASGEAKPWQPAARPRASGEAKLCGEAVRLARILVTQLPGEPEVAGLLALLLLTESRRAARIGPDGGFVPLAAQDRTRWDRELIAEGQAIVRACLRLDRPGQYQLQAAVSAVHADSVSTGRTDWRQILALYDQLLAVAPTPVVALNRAVAVAEVHGPAAALALVEMLELDQYQPYHAVRADLLRRLERHGDAAAAYARAAALAPGTAEREFLLRGGRGD